MVHPGIDSLQALIGEPIEQVGAPTLGCVQMMDSQGRKRCAYMLASRVHMVVGTLGVT